MKSQLSIIAALSILVVFLSNFSADKTESFIMTVVNEGPVLPDVPFDYIVDEIPNHLIASEFDPDTIDLGYEGGGIDTLSFDDITDENATLGRVLFYDEKLSAMENISCGTCHDQSLSFTENKAFSEGINSLTKRNSMHLNDLAWTNDSHFSWDMEQKDLHEMIVLPLTDENEIGANMLEVSQKLASTSYYPDLFAAAYGDATINEERIVDALVQFIKSMTTFDSKLDKGAANNFEDFTQEELNGKDLFGMACGFCHVQGDELTAIFGFDFDGASPLEFFPELFNNGLPKDAEDAGAGEWLNGMDDLFKIPTLRNIELTAPYMHDGRFNTLEEVMDHYAHDAVETDWGSFVPPGGFGFSDQEKSDLIAFLKTFTDKTFITEEKFSDPFEPAILGTSSYNGFEDIILKPNPMLDRAVIEYKNDLGKLVSINILSADGKLLRHDSTQEAAYSLEKDEFDAGLYFIELIMENSRSIQKLIVK